VRRSWLSLIPRPWSSRNSRKKPPSASSERFAAACTIPGAGKFWLASACRPASLTSPASGFETLCAEGTLECGGLTPPWNYRGRKSYTTHKWRPLSLFSQETRSAQCQGGVEPPHSKALRAFSSFPGARQPTNMSDCFENRGAGVPPAVAGASRSRARAGCPRDSGRDARATSVHCRPPFHRFRVPVSRRT